MTDRWSSFRRDIDKYERPPRISVDALRNTKRDWAVGSPCLSGEFAQSGGAAWISPIPQNANATENALGKNGRICSSSGCLGSLCAASDIHRQRTAFAFHSRRSASRTRGKALPRICLHFGGRISDRSKEI